jgi:hypothetical protein
MKQHYDILIATPGRSLEAGYVKSLMQTIQELDNRGISYKWLNSYSSLVHNARETTTTGDDNLNPNDLGPMHDSVTYKKMFWIDSDITWKPEDFIKLYESDYEIIAGAYLLHNGETSTIHTKQYPSGIPKDILLRMNAVSEAESVGFGFVAIKSGVFEKIQRPWFGLLPQAIQNSRGQQLVLSLGEDISWCIKAKHSGFNIYFDPMVKVGHIKSKELSW